jgi:hypothetical protein
MDHFYGIVMLALNLTGLGFSIWRFGVHTGKIVAAVEALTEGTAPSCRRHDKRIGNLEAWRQNQEEGRRGPPVADATA